MSAERIFPEPDFTSPYDGEILSCYTDRFEAVFIVLHPFFKPEADIQYFKFDPDDEDAYLSDRQSFEWCSPVTWVEFLKISQIDSLQNLDGALKNYIGGIRERQRFQSYTNALISTLQKDGLIAPYEGDISLMFLPRIC